MHAVPGSNRKEKPSNQAALRGALLAFAKPPGHGQAQPGTRRVPSSLPISNDRTLAKTDTWAAVTSITTTRPTYTAKAVRPGLHTHSASDTSVPTLRSLTLVQDPISKRVASPTNLAVSRPAATVATSRTSSRESLRSFSGPASLRLPPQCLDVGIQDYFVPAAEPPSGEGDISSWLQGLQDPSVITTEHLRAHGPHVVDNVRSHTPATLGPTALAAGTWPRRTAATSTPSIMVPQGQTPTIFAPKPFRAFSTAGHGSTPEPKRGRLAPLPPSRSPGRSPSPGYFDGARDAITRHRCHASPLATLTTPDDLIYAPHDEFEVRRSYEDYRVGTEASQDNLRRSSSVQPAQVAAWTHRNATVRSNRVPVNGGAHNYSNSVDSSPLISGHHSTFPVQIPIRAQHHARRDIPASESSLMHTSQRRATPFLTGASLASAIAASSLATSRAISPSKVVPLSSTKRHPDRGFFNSLHPFKHGQSASRTPSPIKGMRQTMRKDVSSDEAGTSARRKKKLFRKHPHKHHEGDRKRWRFHVTERERKRYEGVWAANKGILIDLSAVGTSQAEMDAAKSRVSNSVVRDIWMRSRLPANALAEIWDLVDHDLIGSLTRWEFCVGLWLIDQRLKGRKLPVKVSDSVWSSIRGIHGIKLLRYRQS